MILDTIIDNLKKICDDDETCILVILGLVGFLICMYFQKEGFDDFNLKDFGASIKEVDEKQGEIDNRKDIGKKPTELIGNKVNESRPLNGYIGIDEKVNFARAGKQYNGVILSHNEKLDVTHSGIKPGYDWNKTGGIYNLDNQPSDFGFGKPLNVDNMKLDKIPGVKTIDESQDGVAPGMDQSSDTGKETKKLKLVLFYAPWCIHSKNMLADFDSVIQNYNGKTMNNHKLEIIKINMDKNPGAAKEYDVVIKGFPTLYLFEEVNGKTIANVFNFREEKVIIEELKRKTN